MCEVPAMPWAAQHWRHRSSSLGGPSAWRLLLKIAIAGVAVLSLLSLCMALTAAGHDDGLTTADEIDGVMIPSLNNMASLQQALSHSSWGDGSGAGMGRSLLRRRKKDSDAEEDEEDEDDEDEGDKQDDDEDEEDEEDDDDDDDNKKKKRKKRRVKSRASTLLGVQLDMTMMTAGGAGDDEGDEGEDEEEDDDRRRRRHLLAKPAAAAPGSSDALQTWAGTSPLFPDGWLVAIGKLPRSEAEAGCKNVAAGTVEFSIDLKKMLQADGIDDGDDVSKLKVVHHLRCVSPDDKDKSKMVVDRNIKTDHFFVVVTIKSVAAAVDCAKGAADCAVYGPKTMMPPEAIKQIEAKAAKGQRKLLAKKAAPTGFTNKVATPKEGETIKEGTKVSEEGFLGPRSGEEIVKDAREIITTRSASHQIPPDQVQKGAKGARYDGVHPIHGGDADVRVDRFKPAAGDVEVTYTVTFRKNKILLTESVTVLQPRSRCFPAAARVLLSDGTQAAMQQLRHGDRVLTVLPGGQLGFSEVYLFGHKDPDAHANYVALQTKVNTTLLVTPDHYIHIIPRSKAAAGMPLSWKDAVHTRAGKVHPGDVMVHVSWDNCASPSDIASHKGSSCGSMQYATITSAKMQVAKGLYNPYTMVGNIVVDGYSASSHSSLAFLDPLTGTGPYVPYLHQAMLAPVRLIHRMYPSLMAHVDQQYSRDAWASAGVAKVVGSIVQYHLKGV